MKLGPVIKFDKNNVKKRHKQNNVKKIDNDVMSANYDIIVIDPIYGQFGAIRKPDSVCIVCKTCIFIDNNFLSYQT